MASPVEVASRLSAVIELQQQILSAVTDPETVMKLVVESTPEATSGTGASIGLIHGEDMVFRATSGLAAGRVGYCIPLEGSLSGHAIRDRMVIRCNNTELDPRVDGEAARELGIRSIVVAPLVQGDDVIGALLSYSPNADAFHDLDTHIIQVLAGITSSALLRARELKQRQESEQRYKMLFERNVAGVFRSTADGTILDCNDALVGYLGYGSREELCAQPVWDVYAHREDRLSLLDDIRRDKAVRNARINFKRKDGSVFVGVITISTIPSDDEGPAQLLGTLVAE
jgi:PAS domain S-box-containing protein